MVYNRVGLSVPTKLRNHRHQLTPHLSITPAEIAYLRAVISVHPWQAPAASVLWICLFCTLDLPVLYTGRTGTSTVCGLLSPVSPTCLGSDSTAACQAPLSMAFSRQGYLSGLPFPPPRDLPDPGMEPTSRHWQADSLHEVFRAHPCCSMSQHVIV